MTARCLSLGGSSEGLCTLKFLCSLAEGGHQVHCLTAEDPGPLFAGRQHGFAEALSRIDFEPVSLGTPRRTPWGTGKAVAAFNIFTGTNPADRVGVAAWENALREAHARFRPDYWYIRGAGQDFSPHMAARRVARGTPWVAHFHDPWPVSIMPDPYAAGQGWRSAIVELRARKIVESATVVTVPHSQLGEWMADRLDVDLGRFRAVPHIGYVEAWFGSIPPASLPSRPTLAHAGFLSRQRSPVALLRAMRRCIDDGLDVVFQQTGPIDVKLQRDPSFVRAIDMLRERDATEISSSRVSYHDATRRMVEASAALILSPGRPSSPFFPAKLADAVSLRIPMIGLAPSHSVVQEALGSWGGNVAPLDDEPAVETTLRRFLVEGSKPTPQALVDWVSPKSVAHSIDELPVG